VPARSENDGRSSLALSIWDEAKSIEDTPAERYLASRGIWYAGQALRWHPSCLFGQGERRGCMLGLVRNILTNKSQAIHRTAVDASGRKIDRKALGPIGCGAIKLSDDAEVTYSVAIAEGIETTLSIGRRFPDLASSPIWSVLSAQGIASFPKLVGLQSLWIFADNDVSGTGQQAAATARDRLTAEDIEVITTTPSLVGDFNDEVRRHGL
jgi:hypothetical protein